MARRVTAIWRLGVGRVAVAAICQGIALGPLAAAGAPRKLSADASGVFERGRSPSPARLNPRASASGRSMRPCSAPRPIRWRSALAPCSCSRAAATLVPSPARSSYASARCKLAVEAERVPVAGLAGSACGWWTLFELPAGLEGELELTLLARLDGQPGRGRRSEPCASPRVRPDWRRPPRAWSAAGARR